MYFICHFSKRALLTSLCWYLCRSWNHDPIVFICSISLKERTTLKGCCKSGRLRPSTRKTLIILYQRFFTSQRILTPCKCSLNILLTTMPAIFVKSHQWPTPSESIAIYCETKLVSCVTHLQSCAQVDKWNKKQKIRTVAKIKTQDYKTWRLQNLSTIVTPPLNTATTLFNEHRSQRPFGNSDWQNILFAFSVVSVSGDHVVCNRP